MGRSAGARGLGCIGATWLTSVQAGCHSKAHTAGCKHCGQQHAAGGQMRGLPAGT